MSIKKNGLKSLAVAAVIAMASATASAEVVSAVTANGYHQLMDTPAPVGGMTSTVFKHSGGRLVAMYSSECGASVAPQYSDRAIVDVNILVTNAADSQVVATLSPSDGTSAFCSSGGAPGTFSTVGVSNLPPGTYRVSVRARLSHERASGWMGARSLVVMR